REIERDAGERQRVAERDQIAGALGRHDARDARDREDIALFRGAVADGAGGIERHGDAAGGHRLARGDGLGGDIDHAGGAALVEMGEVTHPTSALVAASTSDWRISASPIRKQWMPRSARASR